MSRLPLVLSCALAALTLVALTPTSSRADDAPPISAGTEAARAKAQEHFKRAKELYQAGSYRDAVTELDAARALDPEAKELVFNLGIVHEKLGQFDEAVTQFRAYIEMEGITAAERAKAEAVIKRIEGAKREVPAAATSTAAPPPPPPPPTREEPRRGRVDVATVGVAGLAVAGFTVGTIFGVRALSTQPKDFVTGRDGSVDDLRAQTDTAHTSAIIADVGIGVGAVATLAALYLYFGRTRTPVRTGLRATPSAVALPGGGALLLGGVFR